MFGMVPVAKPVLVNFKLYVPGVTLGKTYCPAEFVSVDLTSFVAVFVISTVTPGATAPAGSVTVPSTAPVAEVWPQLGDAKKRMAAKPIHAHANLFEIIIEPPTPNQLSSKNQADKDIHGSGIALEEKAKVVE